MAANQEAYAYVYENVGFNVLPSQEAVGYVDENTISSETTRLIHIHGTYFDATGKPLSGTIEFHLEDRQASTEDNIIIAPGYFTVKVDGGYLESDVYFIQGATYTIIEKFEGRSYPYRGVVLPLIDDVDLADVK